jgi:heat-inducible transcriptional repressor
MERQVFQRLEQMDYWERLLSRFGASENHDIYFVLGDEGYADPIYDTCASIFGEFEANTIKGIIGVVGPKRMHYDLIAPQIKYFSTLLEEIMKEQKLGVTI